MTDSRAASTPRFGTGRTSYMYGFVLHSVGIHRREVDEQTVLVPHGAKIRSELCRPSGAVPHATKQGRRPSTTGSTSDAPLHLYNPPQPQRFQPRELRQATCAQRCPGPRRSPERRAIRTGRSRTHLASTVTDQPVHSVVVPDDLEHLPDVVDNDAQERSLKRLMSKGLQITEPSLSGAVGAAVGLVGGPAGLVVGGAIGGLLSIAIKKLCFEMDNRLMGPRERARVGAVCALGAAEIVRRIDTGEKLREDGFFGGLYTELDGDRLGWQAVPSGWCPLVVRFGHRFGG